jgi:predicted nuclease with RNAse H fold
MKALGIDLATESKKTGVVVVEVDAAGNAVAHRIAEAASDDVLVALAREVDVISVDAPFGWPRGFTEALAAHGAGRGWPLTVPGAAGHPERIGHCCAIVRPTAPYMRGRASGLCR